VLVDEFVLQEALEVGESGGFGVLLFERLDPIFIFSGKDISQIGVDFPTL
jgi:hypothetical protein